jgi:hypothetical protein
MTDRQTNPSDNTICKREYISGTFPFKGHDSYCNLIAYSSYAGRWQP